MTPDEWAARVTPHGPLVQLAPRLWCVTGSLRAMPLPRNMVVWRMDDGGLMLHSVVALDRAGMAELEALGQPKLLVVPSGGHRTDIVAYKERYPDARLLCPEAAQRQVEKVVVAEGSCEAVLPDHGVRVLAPDGLTHAELVYDVEVGPGQRALIFNDQVFHCEHLPGLQGALMRYVTQSTGFFGITRLGRWLGLRDRQAFKAWLDDQAHRTELSVVTMSHGDPVTGLDVAIRLGEAMGRL